MRGLDFPSVVRDVANGDIKHVMEMVPEVFLDDVKRWVEEIQIAVADLKAQAAAVFDIAPKADRKAFAAYVDEHHPSLAPYLIAMLDGHPVEPVIYRHAFKDETRSKQDA
jgi:hypothetical protein